MDESNPVHLSPLLRHPLRQSAAASGGAYDVDDGANASSGATHADASDQLSAEMLNHDGIATVGDVACCFDAGDVAALNAMVMVAYFTVCDCSIADATHQLPIATITVAYCVFVDVVAAEYVAVHCLL